MGKATQEQITLRLPKAELAKVGKLCARLHPLVATRADLLRMAFELGMKAVEDVAVAYEKARR